MPHKDPAARLANKRALTARWKLENPERVKRKCGIRGRGRASSRDNPMRKRIVMSDQSAPETLEVRLVNRAGAATLHKYDHTEELPAVGPDGKPDGSGFAHFFRCTQTGAVQRYGFDKLGSESPEAES